MTRKPFALSPNVVPIKGRTVAEIDASEGWQAAVEREEASRRNDDEREHGGASRS